ncbi:MAG: tRNA(His) guanylyltransferase Thg1 family protein [Ktedonobacterales bacterium]
MDNDEFEKRMRELEYFHQLRALPGAWIVLRLDGRGFSRFTASRFEKPFDSALHSLMAQTAQSLLQELHAIYAYTESDEISVLLGPDYALFDREVEKLVSISASIATATFTLAAQAAVHFDSRMWLGANEQQVADYFRWRMADAERGSLHAWSYWTLRKAGQDVAEATARLQGATIADKNELLFQHGINYNDLPAWQRRGTGLYWQSYEKIGYDPKHEQEVTTQRRRITVDEDLPMKDAYTAFILKLLESARPKDESTEG